MKGRSKAKIDWDKVDKYLEAGANGVQVAAMLGIHYNTLARRCAKEKECVFSEYLRQKREKGNNLLILKQYEIAMQGDKAMLIWLGKNRLGQTDKKENTHIGNMFSKIEIIEEVEDGEACETEDKE